MTPAIRLPPAGRPAYQTGPRYELRIVADRGGKWTIAVWQMPAGATPGIAEPQAAGALGGDAFRFLETRLLRRLWRLRIQPGKLMPGQSRDWPLDEDSAVQMALLFRAVSPMRNLDRIGQVADAIDAMSREEAGYWLGMSMYRERPRRVLAALRLLITTK
jgi:hypothetical protein